MDTTTKGKITAKNITPKTFQVVYECGLCGQSVEFRQEEKKRCRCGQLYQCRVMVGKASTV
jgi:predicted RNA-binding Zn-ribbon protein involved in translation (DUF1610 family)